MKLFGNTISPKTQKITFFGLLVWLIAVLFFLYEFFLRTLIGSLSSQIIVQLHLTAEQFALLETGYAVGYGVMQIPAGLITDSIGLKYAMTAAITICAIAVLLLAYSHGLTLALSSRVLMAIGSSFSFICLLIVIFSWLPHRFSAVFTGLSQFLGTLGPLFAMGPLVFFVKQLHGNWRLSLSYVAVFGLLLAFITFIFMKESKEQVQDIREQIIPKAPIVSRLFSVFKEKQVWFIALFSGASYVPITLIGITWGAAYLQAHHFSQQAAADAVSITWLAYAIACPIFGVLSDFFKCRKPMLWLASLIGLLGALGVCFFSHASLTVYSGFFALIGIAAAGQTIAFVMLADFLTPHYRASAIGFTNAIISGFIAVMPLIVGLFIHHKLSLVVTHFSVKDFKIGFLFLPILYLLSLLIATFFIKETCDSVVSL